MRIRSRVGEALQKNVGTAFLIFAVTTIIIASLIIILNTYSPLQSTGVLSDAKKHSSELSYGLYDIQNQFAESARIMTRYLPETNDPLTNEEYLDQLVASIHAVSSDFSRQRELVLGYFFNIDADVSSAEYEVFCNTKTGAVSHISMLLGYMSKNEHASMENKVCELGDTVWLTINQPIYNIYYLACVAPLVVNGKYIGFTGLVIDCGSLKENFSELRSTDWQYSFLLTENNEIMVHDRIANGERVEYADSKHLAPLAEAISQNSESGTVIMRDSIDSRYWIYAYDRMPSGQTYVEAQQRLQRTQATNLLIMQVALMSIIATALVQKRRGGNDSVFDSISNRVLKPQADVHPTLYNASRAVLALNIGCIGGIGSHLLSLILSGGTFRQLALFSLVLVLLIAALRSYRMRGLSMKKLILLAILMLSLPVVMQIMESTLGVSIIWLLISVVGALFLLNKNNARIIFYSFVVVLFLYTLLELFIFRDTSPQTLMPIVGNLFFLAFALFSSVGIYVESAEHDYEIIEDTLTQLKNTQSLLVQREKMVTLGQLIAGVAHEINTPLGAIKASAETINASLKNVFLTLMKRSRDFDEQDFDDFFRLCDIASESVMEMNSTSAARRARPSIRAFADSLNSDSSESIADSLIRLEICNIGLLEQNADVFKNPKVSLMLELLCDISPVVSGGQTIQYAAARAGKIVFALKSYSRGSAPGETVLFDAAQSIENVLILYQNQIKQNIELIKQFDDPPPTIIGCADEIGQVWTNLISNAIQAMPEGGTLTITLHDDGNGNVLISFQDTGCGIAADAVSRIFEPFYTTKPLGEGTGLGLDISQKIIARHGGTISVESELGIGSVFSVTLPAMINAEVTQYEQ